MAKKNLVRSIKFTTRLNAQERKKLNAVAKRSKLTPSEVVRSAIARLS